MYMKPALERKERLLVYGVKRSFYLSLKPSSSGYLTLEIVDIPVHEKFVLVATIVARHQQPLDALFLIKDGVR